MGFYTQHMSRLLVTILISISFHDIFNRCELILNSARLNSGVQISTRNSCKTLKCPQCNWHYKYQETLEIHMREKHPDGESACGYCLAGKLKLVMNFTAAFDGKKFFLL